MESRKQKVRGGVGWLLVLFAIVLGIALWNSSNNTEQARDKTSEEVTVVSENIVLEGEEGKTVLEILEAKYEVKKEVYDFGTMVQAINNLEANEENFWAFYVNGQMANQGADSQITKEGDLIEWRYEAIK